MQSLWHLGTGIWHLYNRHSALRIWHFALHIYNSHTLVVFVKILLATVLPEFLLGTIIQMTAEKQKMWAKERILNTVYLKVTGRREALLLKIFDKKEN